MAEPRCMAGQKAPFDDIPNYRMLTKRTSSCKASSALSTQSRFIPLCRNRMKKQGRGSTHPPPLPTPQYHDGALGLLVRPRVTVNVNV